MARQGGSALGTLIVIAAIVGLSWLALRKMTETQKELVGKIDAAVAQQSGVPGPQLVPTIPEPILASAGKQQVLRLDVVLRVDGLDVTSDGAPACRDGNKRLIGRAPNGPAGSFDESALLACIGALRAKFPTHKPVALVTRAGPAVPETFMDALKAALGRAGVSDIVVSH